MPPDLAYLLPPGPPPHSLRRALIRRPRAHVCACRARSRTVVACKTERDRDREWFGIKTWFRPRESDAPPASDGNGTHAEREEEPDALRPAETPQSHERRDARDDSERGFRWPWQKESDEESGETAQVRHVSHSDSKPGAFGRRRADAALEETPPDKVSWQERWRRVVTVIAPGFAKDKEGADDGSVENGVAVDDVQNESRHEARRKEPLAEEKRDRPVEKKARRVGSITELYQPPAEKSKKPDDSGWFKLPWNREREQEADAGKENATTDEEVETHLQREERAEKGEDEDRQLQRPVPKVKVTVPVAETELVKEEPDPDVSEKENPAEEKKREAAVALRSGKATSPKPPLLDIVSIPQRDVATIRLIFGSETFFATETLTAPGGLIFRGNLRGEPKATLAKLEERLMARLGDKYTLCLAEGEEDLRPVVVVVPTARDKRPATPRQKFMAVVVALMTISTCLGRGLFAIVLKPTILALHGPPPRDHVLYPLFGMASTGSLAIAAAIVLIIAASQIVQRLVASRHNTRIAIPFFLPSYQLGSFGAVVQIASPTPTRAALFDIALSGAGTLVLLSVACLLVGLRLSTSFPFVLPVPMNLVSSSVVMGYLTQQVPDGKILIDYGRSLIGLHPLAIIGANCLTIAALNLLPIRQLDGGRIISALYGRKTAALASRVTVLFLLLASSKSPYFIVFLAAITFGPWSLDRPARNELTEPDGFRTIVGYLFMLLMVGILLPFPACKFFGTS